MRVSGQAVIDNVADPGSPEVLDADTFAQTFIDRRRFHVPSLRDGDRRVAYTPAHRPWSQVTGVTLHQTACLLGERLERYDTIGAHWAVLRSGRVLRMCDDDRIVVHGNGFNTRCVGVEIDGLYAGLEDDPDTAQDEALRSTWDDPTTPTREQPMKVTPQAMRATRQLVRWIAINTWRQNGEIKVLCAHRQASASRRSDPGSEIWRQVALPLHRELGLSDGGVGFSIGGLPIPERWDPRCKGIPY